MPPGTRILGMIAVATRTMTRQTVNSMWFRRNQVLSRRTSILAFRRQLDCTFVHRACWIKRARYRAHELELFRLSRGRRRGERIEAPDCLGLRVKRLEQRHQTGNREEVMIPRVHVQ